MIKGRPDCGSCKGSGLVPSFSWVPFSDSNSQLCDCIRENNGWFPIETAPRNGTPILAYNPVIGVYNTAYQKDEPNEGDRFPCGFAGYLGKWFCYPTHWRYPPERPK